MTRPETLIFPKIVEGFAIRIRQKKKNQNSALIEREDLISWRRGYLLKIRHCCAQNRPVYYLDETWSTQRR